MLWETSMADHPAVLPASLPKPTCVTKNTNKSLSRRESFSKLAFSMKLRIVG